MHFVVALTSLRSPPTPPSLMRPFVVVLSCHWPSAKPRYVMTRAAPSSDGICYLSFWPSPSSGVPYQPPKTAELYPSHDQPSGNRYGRCIRCSIERCSVFLLGSFSYFNFLCVCFWCVLFFQFRFRISALKETY